MRDRALTIAGWDPTGGAGVAQDLRTFAACGVWGFGAITAVTAQDTMEVHAWEVVAEELVRAQIAAVVQDGGVKATKTGMLGTMAHVEMVARAARDLELGPLIVDPVLVSTSGGGLAREGVCEAIRSELLPRAALVTPNIAEASALTGVAIGDPASMREGARALRALGARAALVTGGHLDGDAIDVLMDADGVFHDIAAPRIVSDDDHGTGCVLSAAIAAHLARGDHLIDAVRSAKGVVGRALRNAQRFGAGRGAVDPSATGSPWPLAGHPFE